MIDHLYQNTILKNPRSILVILLITLISFGYYSKDFRLDASSETLLIEGDPDLEYLKEITNRYGSKEFLVLTHTPNDGMVTDSAINNLLSLKYKLQSLNWVHSVVTLLDIPLLDNSDAPLQERLKNFNKQKVLDYLKGNFAIGHNRYSTTGNNTLRNIQPFFADTNAGGIGVAHNGNLTNSIYLRNKLVEDGAIFYTTSDTETIVQLIAKSKRSKTIDKIIDAIFQIQGGYALVMLTQNSLVGVRDPHGIRPLVIGKLKNSFVLASETCALDIIGAKFIREVENGEIVMNV